MVLIEIMHSLEAAGHQVSHLRKSQIELIVREGSRKPPLGGCELAFMEELKAHGIPTGFFIPAEFIPGSSIGPVWEG